MDVIINDLDRSIRAISVACHSQRGEQQYYPGLADEMIDKLNEKIYPRVSQIIEYIRARNSCLLKDFPFKVQRFPVPMVNDDQQYVPCQRMMTNRSEGLSNSILFCVLVVHVYLILLHS